MENQSIANPTRPAAGRVNLAAVDEKKVDYYLAELKLRGGGEVGLKVNRLVEHFYAQESLGVEVATCDVCGGSSSSSLPECPYCGDASEVVHEEVTAVTPKKAVASAAAAGNGAGVSHAPTKSPQKRSSVKPPPKLRAVPPPAPEEDEPFAEDEAPTAPVAAKAKRSAASKPAPKAKPEKVAPAAKAKPAAAKAKPEKAAPAKEEKPSTAIVHRGKDVSAVVAEFAKPDKKKAAELKLAMKAVREHQQAMGTSAAENLHGIGKALIQIQSGDLWRQLRGGEDKAPLYTNFKMFMLEQFGISHAYGFQAMGVAEKYTLAQVRKLGATNARVILQLPEDKRAAAEQLAERGGTKREIAAMREPAEGKRRVTVALMLGQYVVPAFAIATPEAKQRPARTLKDEPAGTLSLENGISIRFHLTRTHGSDELKYVVTLMRDGKPIIDAPAEEK